MARKRVPVVGGPADGAVVKAAPGCFRWISVAGAVYGAAGPGRGLYRGEGGRWLYVGGQQRPCPGCGAFVSRDAGPGCPLCGAAL